MAMHTERELEHRLTTIEVTQVERARTNEDRFREAETGLEAIQSRMTWHERAILALAAIQQTLLQDAYPNIAEMIKKLLRP